MSSFTEADFLSAYAARFADANSLAAKRAAYFAVAEQLASPRPTDVITHDGRVGSHGVVVCDVDDETPEASMLYLPTSLEAGATLAHLSVAERLASDTGLRVILPDFRDPDQARDAADDLIKTLSREKQIVVLGDGAGANLAGAFNNARIAARILVDERRSRDTRGVTRPLPLHLHLHFAGRPELLWRPDVSSRARTLWLNVTMNAAAFAKGLWRG